MLHSRNYREGQLLLVKSYDFTMGLHKKYTPFCDHFWTISIDSNFIKGTVENKYILSKSDREKMYIFIQLPNKLWFCILVL